MLSARQRATREQRWTTLAVSAALHVGAFAVLLAYQPPRETPVATREVVTPLIFYKAPPPVHVKLQAPRLPKSIPAPRATPPVVAKQLPPLPLADKPKTTIAAPEPLPQIASAAPLPATQIKGPDLPSRPSPPPVPVKTGVFETAGQSPKGHTPAPRLEVHTGGFAGPETQRGASANGSPSGAVHLGGFGDSTTATAQRGNGHQSVAEAGFGSGAGGPLNGTGGNGTRQVADAGFGNGASKTAPAARRTDTAAGETPVEVVWKPKPVYTNEARAKKLEGDVTLEVVFHAAGNVQVLRVVRGLGSGLDESARNAAEQIRFRPGRKDGVPVDRTGLIQITFELS